MVRCRARAVASGAGFLRVNCTSSRAELKGDTQVANADELKAFEMVNDHEKRLKDMEERLAALEGWSDQFGDGESPKPKKKKD